MPHVTLEYSNNINANINLNDLFGKIHNIIAETAGADINACKSRAHKLDEYYIGDGDSGHAFVHVDIALLQGRALEVRDKLSSACFELIKASYPPNELKMHFSVSVTELDKATYKK